MESRTLGVITINPEYFDRAVNDYSNPAWALIRELFQNSKDAPGCRTIRIDFDAFLGVLTVHNDGAPMDHDVLFHKFLALGGSNKPSDGTTVGGFGRAKELYFCQKHYVIETGEFKVSGSGGNFSTSQPDGEYYNGTKSTITLSSRFTAMDYQIRKFLSYCQWDGKVFYNGKEIVCNLNAGEAKCSYGFGHVHVLEDENLRDLFGICIVRVKGLPMFSQLHDGDGVIVVEIDMPSPEALVSNRDSFKYPYYQTFSNFISDLGRNTAAAFKVEWEITEYLGNRVKVRNVRSVYALGDDEDGVEDTKDMPSITTLDVVSRIAAFKIPDCSHVSHVTVDEQIDDYVDPVAKDQQTIVLKYGGVTNKIGHQFYVANNTGVPVPDWFTPSNMGRYCMEVAQKWVEYLVNIHGILGIDGEFSVGFIFSDRYPAMYDHTRKCYYINPVVMTKQAGTVSFKKKWKSLRRHACEIAMMAGHEIVHGTGHMSHDESFAYEFTNVAIKIAENIKMFK